MGNTQCKGLWEEEGASRVRANKNANRGEVGKGQVVKGFKMPNGSYTDKSLRAI